MPPTARTAEHTATGTGAHTPFNRLWIHATCVRHLQCMHLPGYLQVQSGAFACMQSACMRTWQHALCYYPKLPSVTVHGIQLHALRSSPQTRRAPYNTWAHQGRRVVIAACMQWTFWLCCWADPYTTLNSLTLSWLRLPIARSGVGAFQPRCAWCTMCGRYGLLSGWVDAYGRVVSAPRNLHPAARGAGSGGRALQGT